MFMAPEQAKAAKVIGPGVDIYALGAILYNMIVGHPPFEGDLPQLLAAHLFEKPVTPSQRGVTISPELEALIMQCLEKEPEQRPQKMFEIRDRLTGTEGKKYTEMIKAVSASQPGTQQRPVVTKSQIGSAQTQHPSTLTGAASEVVTPAAAHATKKNPMKSVLVAAAAVVLLAGGAIVLTKKPPPPPKPVAAVPVPVQPKPAAAPTVPKVHVALKLDPPDARVELDGIATSENPIDLPQSETAHTLVVSAPGKQSVTRELRAMTSGEVSVQLQAEVKVAAPVHHPGSGHAKPAAPPKNKVRGPVETDL
jgi:serine/threonine-protein kinase